MLLFYVFNCFVLTELPHRFIYLKVNSSVMQIFFNALTLLSHKHTFSQMIKLQNNFYLLEKACKENWFPSLWLFNYYLASYHLCICHSVMIASALEIPYQHYNIVLKWMAQMMLYVVCKEWTCPRVGSRGFRVAFTAGREGQRTLKMTPEFALAKRGMLVCPHTVCVCHSVCHCTCIHYTSVWCCAQKRRGGKFMSECFCHRHGNYGSF